MYLLRLAKLNENSLFVFLVQTGLKKLEDVDLVENPVTLLEDYKRDAIFEAIPTLKVSENQVKISPIPEETVNLLFQLGPFILI